MVKTLQPSLLSSAGVTTDAAPHPRRVQRIDVDGGLLVGMGAADGAEDAAQGVGGHEGLQSDLIDAFESSALADRRVRAFGPEERPRAAEAEAALFVVADPTTTAPVSCCR